MTKNVRSCESCHASNKALGLGIGGPRPWNERHFVDLETVDGEILPQQTQPQMEPIENLTQDWSRIVEEEGNQLATVGHHFQLSRAFNKEEQLHISRQGTCLACHQEIPKESLAVSFLHHVAKYTGQLPKTRDQHSGLLHKILLSSARLQTGAVIGGPLALIAVVAWRRRRRRRKAD